MWWTWRRLWINPATLLMIEELLPQFPFSFPFRLHFRWVIYLPDLYAARHPHLHPAALPWRTYFYSPAIATKCQDGSQTLVKDSKLWLYVINHYTNWKYEIIVCWERRTADTHAKQTLSEVDFIKKKTFSSRSCSSESRLGPLPFHWVVKMSFRIY